MVLFSVLMSLGIFVLIVRIETIEGNLSNTFEDSLLYKDIACEIVSSELTCETETVETFYNDDFFVISIDSREEVEYGDYDLTFFNVIFHGNQVLVSTYGFHFEFNLSELPSELQNIDFGLIISDKEAFSDQFIGGLMEYLEATRGSWGIWVMALEIVSNFVFVILITLINSWVINMRFKIIPFKEVFKMSAYLGTSLYLLLVFNSLVNLGYLLIFVFIIISIRQTNALTMEIMRVIKKK
jgi:hypothetical protein